VALNNSTKDFFQFNGKSMNIVSGWYGASVRNILLFGEFSANNSGKHSIVQGVTLKPSDRITFNFLFRDMDPGYIAFHSNPPASGSATGNETGLLGSVSFEAAKHLFFSGGCDLVRYPWLKYRLSSPSYSNRKELKIRYLPNKDLLIEAVYSNKTFFTDNNSSVGIPEQLEEKSRGLRFSIRFSPSNSLTLTSRFDNKRTYPTLSDGNMLLQDVIYRIPGGPITIWFRYAIFKTDDWDSRIYTYENDLLYSFSIPAFSGEGKRSYLMVKWNLKDIAEFRIKYGITSLNEKTETSDCREELKFQARIWF
jgi:hypothetical protein